MLRGLASGSVLMKGFAVPSGWGGAIAATGLASVSCGALVFVKVMLTGRWNSLSLLWNLFLAWLPLVLALGAHGASRRGAAQGGWLAVCSAAWLLSFPNAPYIFTDLVHLNPAAHSTFWLNLVLMSLCALTGLVVGFLSLFLMHGLVQRRVGATAGWVFVVGAAALAGFGMYLGRFYRWNSWDLLMNPARLAGDVGYWARNVSADSRSAVIPALFGVFVLLSYLLLYSLTGLRTGRPGVVEPTRPELP